MRAVRTTVIVLAVSRALCANERVSRIDLPGSTYCWYLDYTYHRLCSYDEYMRVLCGGNFLVVFVHGNPRKIYPPDLYGCFVFVPLCWFVSFVVTRASTHTTSRYLLCARKEAKLAAVPAPTWSEGAGQISYMAIQPSSLSLSWVGSSCLCPQDAERELVALREKVILHKGESFISYSIRRLFVRSKAAHHTIRCMIHTWYDVVVCALCVVL